MIRPMARVLTILWIGLTLLGGRAGAEPVTLRFASLVPEGTAWARELKAFSRDVEMLSHGQLKVKWYLGGIAGDERMVPERVKKGQIDGEAAGVSCVDLAPSLRVLRVLGMFRRRDEAHAIIARMRPRLVEEFAASGFIPLALTWFGSDLAFTREPVRSLAELKRLKLWIWNLDPVWGTELARQGFHAVPLSLEEAGRAYEDKRVDGFLALPTAALAFQWSAQTHFFSNLALAAMAACTVISRRVFDALPLESQSALKAAAAKANLRFEDVNASQEDALIGGLFDRQGTHRIPASTAFRTEFLDAARAARDTLPENVVPRALITQVQGWLSDFRAEHP
jgi:TRAP-type C4-dicarboxylate transport system substrate-binding protein